MSVDEDELEAVEEEVYGEHVLVRRCGQIGQVVLDWPEKLNALGKGMIEGMQRGFDDLGAEENIKVIIFRGEGRAFSTGGDMSTIGTQYNQGDLHVRPPQRRRLHADLGLANGVWESIAYSPKVVIAEGKGYVLGVSLDLFCAADIIVCSEGTVFGYPPARMMAHTGVSTLFWMLRMGPALHAEICLMGRYVTAEEGLRHGLVNRVVPADQLEDTVQAAADSVCNLPADGLYVGKLNKKFAWDLLGARTSAMESSMGHTIGVQQKLDPGDYNLIRSRNEKGMKGTVQARDEPFQETARRYDPSGVIM